MRMRSLLLPLAVACATANLAHAQMSFEGLDLGSKKKKKTKAKKPGQKEEAEKKEEKEADAPLPAGGLDLNKPVEAEKKAEKPAPTMSFEAVDVSGKSSDRQKLDAALDQFRKESYEQAALAAHDLMRDPKMVGLHLEAQYLLAKSLYRMGLYHSSLGEFSKILAKGPGTKFFKSSLEWLFFLSHKTLNETVILDEIAKYANHEFPERFRTEFHYLLARYHFVRGKALDQVEQRAEADRSFAEVRRLVTMVPKGDAFYPKAKYLEGLAFFREGKPEIALNAFKEVVRVTKRQQGPVTPEVKVNQQLRELAFMQLARTHYGAQQPGFSVHYFGKVERGNPQWLESLFESSWGSYRLGRYEQALGNMITLSSPFFREEYFPEALILKAVIYFENCRYRESLMILEDFENIYVPVHDQLQLLVNQKLGPTEYYGILLEIQKKNRQGLEISGTDQILERVLRLALTDQDLKKTNDSVLELETEIDSLGQKGDAFKYSDLTKTLIEGLKAHREALIQKGGQMTLGKLEFELGELKQFIANALRIRFETTGKEKEYLELQLQQGGQKEIVRQYRYSTGVPDDHLYWPFNGEYWRDELGTYQYTLTKGCIERAPPTATTAEAGL